MFFSRAETVLGRIAVRAMLLSFVVGAPVAIGVALISGNGGVLLASVAANFLFFGGLAAGGVAISATVMTVKGSWASSLLPAAEACGAFFPPAWGLLAIAMLGVRFWTPWGTREGPSHAAIVAARDLAFAAVLYTAGWFFLAKARVGSRVPGRAAIYLLCFAVFLSILTYDVAMSLYDGEPSTVEPPLYFMGALLAGLAWSTTVATFESVSELDPEGRHDAGKLLFAFATFWGYLLWSAFLPTWYANFPDETGLLLRRVAGWYRPLTAFAVFAAVILPAMLLLFEEAKRNRYVLRFAGLSVFAGFHAACYLFVFPDLPFRASPAGAVVAAGVTVATGGVFVLVYASSFARFNARKPAAVEAESPATGGAV